MSAALLVFSLLWAGTPPEAWEALIEARHSRDISILKEQEWTSRTRTPLAMQEYLLTLGQIGNPLAAERIAAYFADERLGQTALLAYGELMAADPEPPLGPWQSIPPISRVLALEATCKLAGANYPELNQRILSLWQGMQPIEPPLPTRPAILIPSPFSNSDPSG